MQSHNQSELRPLLHVHPIHTQVANRPDHADGELPAVARTKPLVSVSPFNRPLASMTMAWNNAERVEEALKQRRGGAALFGHLKMLYAQRKLTAKDLAICCHHCVEAGVRGADFASMAAAPDKSTGFYQKVVDRALPPFGPLYMVPTPVMQRSAVHREVRAVPVNPLHEAIAREVRQDPLILERVREHRWPAAYTNHPLVVEARAQGKQWPLPLALYMDGVRYTAPLAGRSDSILGIWAYNGVTEKRHYLASLRAQDTCKCGCRGWCSLYPLMLSLAWSLRALAEGRRPSVRHDSTEWDPEDPVFRMSLEHGPALPQCVLIWLKGDWAEVHHSLGLPSVMSRCAPCPMCASPQGRLHDMYRSFEFVARAQSYEAACAAREIAVQVATAADRDAIVGQLMFRKGRTGFGREIKSGVAVNGVVLEARDRLSPTPTMPDVMLLDSAVPPFTLVFWRPRRDFARRLRDPVVRRNPVFAEDICAGPAEVLAVDTLHTVYLGVIMRLVSAILWRMLLANTWNIHGSQEQILEMGVRRMAAHMLRWFEEARTPSDRRVATLSLPMLGDRMGCTVGGAEPHAGCPMRLKGAEMGSLLPWSLALLEQHGQAVAHRAALLAAGRSLESWLEVTRQSGDVLEMVESQELMDQAARFLANCARAGVHFVPKHHFFAHMSSRARVLGNPKLYSCFKDEALNLTLRTIAENSHRAKQEVRIFTHFHLLGRFGFSPFLYGD